MDGMAHFTSEQPGAGAMSAAAAGRLATLDGAAAGSSLPRRRRTLKAAIGCVGVGLHSGRRVSLVLRPAPAGAGIVFRRTDIGADIPARWDLVTDTRLCTVLSLPDRPEASVGTVEHVMAALFGCGIDDAVVELDGPELPILDGSAAPFAFLLDCAGSIAQPGAPAAETVIVRRTVRVSRGPAWAELRPSPTAGLGLSLRIAFDAPAIGEQALSLHLGEEDFRAGLASARTFTLARDVDALRAAGLARGGSLENAVVVDGAQVLNPAGLRMPDEFVRHKVLDAVGDLALAGARLQGRFVGFRSGHQINNLLVRALFADAGNYVRRGGGVTGWPAAGIAAAA